MSKSEIEQLRDLVIERVDMSREPDDSELHEIIDSVIEKIRITDMSIKKRQIIHKKYIPQLEVRHNRGAAGRT